LPCVDLKDALDFVAGRAASGAAAAIEAHLEGCAACRDLVLAVAGPPKLSSDDGSATMAADAATPRASALAAEAPIARGGSVGRYTILGVVGRGSYGEVFAAYDPELDRKVAIKFLHGVGQGGSLASDSRLLREAKAIAKLSHPNVVTVHDAGTFAGRVFVAMEFVDGVTLKEWLRERPRARPEILRVFGDAARGLAAAHAAGLVHRDFKPGNVMVGRDGRVLVMDFGLVRTIGDDDSRQTFASALSSEHELELTRTGELVGTPAYMAPEQFLGERTDARTDQFSFCVSLYGALYGARPFAGEAFLALRENVLAERVSPAPERSGVPAWIRRALLRGLSAKPDARFPSMTALVEALEADPASRRRVRFAVAAVAAIGLAAAVGVVRVQSRTRAACAAGGARLAGIWDGGGVDSPRRRAVHEAFARTGKAYAESTFARVAALLDGYAERWTATFRDACEATRVRGEQPADVLALRETCLDDRARDLRALGDVFARADAVVVQNAISAASALPALEACSDVPALRAGQPFADPAMRQRAGELRDRLARVQALLGAGQCAAADAEGRPLLADTRAAKSRPLLAEALALMGTLGDTCGDARQAIAWDKEAYFMASAARLDRLAAEAAARIPVIAANRLGDEKTAVDWLEILRATLERVGPDDRLQSLAYAAEGLVHEARGEFDAQIAAEGRAVELSRRALGPDHAQTLFQMGNLGGGLVNAGRDAEALAIYREAADLTARTFGAEHASVANLLFNECEALNHLGRAAEAEVACRRALELWGAVGAAESLRSFGRTGLGIALVSLGRWDEAIETLEQALRDRVAGGIAPKQVAETQFALARALWSRPAARARARSLAREARDAVVGNAKQTAAIDAWLAAHA
jgi:tetratricopeptide (TPR) repeat protein